MKVAVLWEHVTGYLAACVRALCRYENTEVILVQRSGGGRSHSEFTIKVPDGVTFLDLSALGPREVAESIQEALAFHADVAIVSLTRRGPYADYVKRASRSGTIVVGASDNYWRGTWRDWANAVWAKAGVFRHYESLLVPGSLGREYGTALSFDECRIFEGLYSCDTALFRPIGEARFADTSSVDWPERFLFVGQLIHRKGVDTLLEAYRAYRDESKRPWDLWLVGKGPLESLADGVAGVQCFGYLDSAKCAPLMAKAGAFVLPSRRDHWGVAIHEATCAGLPIIASRQCGASAVLVEDGRTGLIVDAGDVQGLTQALSEVAEPERAASMGRESFRMSERYSPERWARQLLVDIPRRLRGEMSAMVNDE